MRRVGATILVLSLLAIFRYSYAQQPTTEDFLAHQGITSIAILPPIGESVPSAARQLSADMFATKLKLHTSSVRVLTADETLARLQQKDGANDFAVFITAFSQTGITSPDPLKKMGQTTGTDAVLLIHVLNYNEEKGSWFYGKGGKNVCRIQYSLLRSSNGEKIWETLEFRQHDSKLSTNPYPMERVIGDVSDKAVAALVAGRQNVDVRQKNTQ